MFPCSGFRPLDHFSGHYLEANKLNQFQIFIIRAVIGAVFAVVLTRMFYGRVHIAYVVGLAIIMVGLAYFAEYLRQRKSR
jgi:uncharacterized membrane protein HdeD (DUF308 family)